MYASGEGVPENFVLAYKWANLAAARGSEKARELKSGVKKLMTREQIAEAQQLSLEWEKPKWKIESTAYFFTIVCVFILLNWGNFFFNL